MHDLARAVLVDALFGPDKHRRWPWILAVTGLGLAAYRWKGAKDAGVSLNLAFKHPLTPLATLKAQAPTG
jgi:hypothetical protein